MLTVTALRRQGLGPIDISVRAGTIAALMGASGSGKSLLLRSIADLDPNDGRVSLGDMDRRAFPAPEWRRRVIYVPADSGWWADTVGEHFADRAAAAALLPRLALPPDALDWPVIRLSSGERQRLALVRALTLPRPRDSRRVYLLDEPTGALDAESVDRIEAVLRTVPDATTAILMVTHDRAQADRLAPHHIYLLRDGTLHPLASPPSGPEGTEDGPCPT